MHPMRGGGRECRGREGGGDRGGERRVGSGRGDFLKYFKKLNQFLKYLKMSPARPRPSSSGCPRAPIGGGKTKPNSVIHLVLKFGLEILKSKFEYCEKNSQKFLKVHFVLKSGIHFILKFSRAKFRKFPGKTGKVREGAVRTAPSPPPRLSTLPPHPHPPMQGEGGGVKGVFFVWGGITWDGVQSEG